jgi:hypothetical protein
MLVIAQLSPHYRHSPVSVCQAGSKLAGEFRHRIRRGSGGDRRASPRRSGHSDVCGLRRSRPFHVPDRAASQVWSPREGAVPGKGNGRAAPSEGDGRAALGEGAGVQPQAKAAREPLQPPQAKATYSTAPGEGNECNDCQRKLSQSEHCTHERVSVVSVGKPGVI